MISHIKDPKIRQFIRDHMDQDAELLALARDKYPDIPISFAGIQIRARQKSREKLPFVLDHEEFVFPSMKSFEQSSSVETANFKASLFDGDSCLDLSGGLGVDTLFFSERFKKAVYIERDPQVHEAAAHNFEVLGKEIETHENSAENFLETDPRTFDLIYLDPARRDDTGRRVFLLEDCEPNIIQLAPKLFDRSTRILVKAAPILDIHSVIEKLPVRKIYTVAVNNEVKELLFLLENGHYEEPQIQTINIRKNYREEYSFTLSGEGNARAEIGCPETFLYEPNAAILKAGAFRSIAVSFGLLKLQDHTHLYTSSKLNTNFPGRKFRILHQVKADKKILRNLIPEMKANLSVRNYPMSVDNLRKKTGLKPGGRFYIFGVKTMDNRNSLLITEKIPDLPKM